ncbi:MAG: RidA family protein [Candidatus Binatia bacterium]
MTVGGVPIRRVVRTAGAPEAIGPYSQAIVVGEYLYCSGQIGLDPSTGEIVEGGFARQLRRVFENLGAILSAAGMVFGDIVKLNVYLDDLGNFSLLNEICLEYLADPPPARAVVGVSGLPRGASVELDLIAVRADPGK